MRERPGPLLKNLTTIRLGGKAISEITIENVEEALELPGLLAKNGGEPFYLGRGSNILARDGTLPLTLVRLSDKGEPRIIADDGRQVLVRAWAGMPLSRLLRFCMRNDLGGMEGLIGIPGTVGGAISMNAGSFGNETGKLVKNVTVYEDGRIHDYNASEISTEYRSCRIGSGTCRPLIVEAIFALTKQIKGVIFKHMHLNFLEKKSKQPLLDWSAGCAFKNHAEYPAGLLLERCGFKGKEMGGMAFSGHHANFLVNLGNGSAGAALDLLAEAREAVHSRYGIELAPEVRIIP